MMRVEGHMKHALASRPLDEDISATVLTRLSVYACERVPQTNIEIVAYMYIYIYIYIILHRGPETTLWLASNGLAVPKRMDRSPWAEETKKRRSTLTTLGNAIIGEVQSIPIRRTRRGGCSQTMSSSGKSRVTQKRPAGGAGYGRLHRGEGKGTLLWVRKKLTW